MFFLKPILRNKHEYLERARGLVFRGVNFPYLAQLA